MPSKPYYKAWSKRKPSTKAHIIAYNKKYNARPEVKAKKKLYNQSPERKARKKELYQLRKAEAKLTPEQKLDIALKKLEELSNG